LEFCGFIGLLLAVRERQSKADGRRGVGSDCVDADWKRSRREVRL